LREFFLKRFELMVEGYLAVELLLAAGAGGELVDLAAQVKVGFAAGDLGGERFSRARWQRQQGCEEGGVEVA
jgi:hypothetical protein